MEPGRARPGLSGQAADDIGYALLVGIALAFIFRHWAKGRQEKTGTQYPTGLVALGLIVGLPLVAYLALGRPITFDVPVQKGFNFQGGVQVFPEFVALLLGLVVYTAAFIAEIVRAGIQAVSRGQVEAANALGLRQKPTLNLVVIPQAMRVIAPAPHQPRNLDLHQELLARGRDRLSRSRADFRWHVAQPVRQGDRDHVDDNGGLSGLEPHHLLRDEHL